MTDDCANPLFLGWVKQWLDRAREQNSKGVTVYRKAFDALRRCPVPYDHPAELKVLNGFGDKLCSRLEDLMRQHCLDNALPMPEHPSMKSTKPNRTTGDDPAQQQRTAAKPTKTRKPKAYVPSLRSGAYAIMVALSTLPKDTSSSMTKAQIIELGQPHCDASLSVPTDPTKFYTAWNSMKSLVQKELVSEKGRPLRKYALTDAGWEVAERIRNTDAFCTQNPAPDRIEEEAAEPARSQYSDTVPAQRAGVADQGTADDGALPSFRPIVLPPGSFTVQLLLDIREVRAKTDRDYMKEELAKQGVTPVMRSLEVGDAQWVAKVHDPDRLHRGGAEGDEVVLDWIVERKRLDDLIGSIKDGRFHEQKFRLRKSGARKVVYIIEEFSMDPDVWKKWQVHVTSAMASSQVVDGYFVKQTTKMDDSIKYLARMTGLLKKAYESKPLKVIPTNVLTTQNYLPLLKETRARDPSVGHYITYPAFASISSKSETMTLRDVFLKMLMTTKGVTGEKALEIQKRWKTPHEFVKAFEACGEGRSANKRKYDMVSDQMGHLFGRKKIQGALSKTIAEVWGDPVPETHSQWTAPVVLD